MPNDTDLDGETLRLAIITGPNMAGKSTYIRQVALIVLLAQIGSFVPGGERSRSAWSIASSRGSGANDDLSRGQSTFMVEMNETANIVNNATERSLVILDEIGRGTSTFDGLSIAWSVAEFLHDKIRGAHALRHALPRADQSSPRSAAAFATSTSRCANGTSRSFSCARSSRAARTRATAFKSRGWPVCRRKFSNRAKDILSHLENQMVRLRHRTCARKKRTQKRPPKESTSRSFGPALGSVARARKRQSCPAIFCADEPRRAG